MLTQLYVSVHPFFPTAIRPSELAAELDISPLEAKEILDQSRIGISQPCLLIQLNSYDISLTYFILKILLSFIDHPSNKEANPNVGASLNTSTPQSVSNMQTTPNSLGRTAQEM
jgi:hypothetical protein